MATKLAIIGGTGLGSFFDGKPTVSIKTPYGDASAAPVIAPCHAKPSKNERLSVAFLPRHGNPHSIAPHLVNYRANIWVLKQLGVEQIIAVNAVGGISHDLAPGKLVIPNQVIDYTYGRENTFLDGSALSKEQGFGLDHIDFTYPFTESLRQQLIAAAQICNLPVIDKGVYGAMQGPRLETAAEINKLDNDGCDLVGMTVMPEAVLARELAIDYASLCLVVNPAAGRSKELITLDDIHKVIDSGMVKVKRLLETVVDNVD